MKVETIKHVELRDYWSKSMNLLMADGMMALWLIYLFTLQITKW